MDFRFLRIAAAAALLLSSFTLSAQGVKIRVASQSDFDALQTTVEEAVKKGGRDVVVDFASGTYYYKEGHLSFYKKYYDNVSLSLTGNGEVVLTAGGNDSSVRKCRKNKAVRWQWEFNPESAYLSSGEPLDFNAPVRYAQSRVEILDMASKACRVRLAEAPDPSVAGEAYIWISQWFRGNSYKITKVEGEYVYFTADDLRTTEKGPSIDSDWGYASVLPRYRLINSGNEVYVRDGMVRYGRKAPLHECTASTFLSVRGSHLKSLTLSNLRFEGNGGRRGESKLCALDLYCSKIGKTDISRCVFKYMKTDCIRIVQVGDVSVTRCIFKDCWRGCVFSDVASLRTRVEENNIDDCGLCGDNITAIQCKGEDFLVSRNVLKDFGYGGIASGVHYAAGKDSKVSGTISSNTLYYSREYYEDAPMNLLMDSGAIYFTTQNDDVTVRDNVIHDISGPKDNRGIFLDDGASNIKVFGNQVRNIKNSYTIDSRRVKSVETRSDSKIRKVNVGNEIHDNDTDGKVRFEKR